MEEKVHERLEFGMALAATAGGLDAYTYLVHGEVFAGLQTGNFILLGVHLGQGHWGGAASLFDPYPGLCAWRAGGTLSANQNQQESATVVFSL